MEECMDKHHRNLIFIAGLVLLLSPLAVIGCGQTAPVAIPSSSGANTAATIVKDYADFEVGPLTVTRSGVSVGETATVATNVTNTGGISGTYTAVLEVNGQQGGQQDISIEPGKTETVSFQVTKNTTGSYNLAIDGSTAVLNVYQWPYKIQYDLGSATGELLSVAGDNGHIVHFTPPTTPFKIQEIDVYVSAVVANESEWTDKLITVRIWDSGRTRQLWSVNLPWRAFWNETGGFWKTIDVPNVSVDNDFYVEMVTHSNQFQGEMVAWPWGSEVRPAVFVGYDRPNQYIESGESSVETRSGISLMGQPVQVPVKYEGINWLMRVWGDGRL
jgi:CARDB